jgi:hypothetical protein
MPRRPGHRAVIAIFAAAVVPGSVAIALASPRFSATFQLTLRSTMPAASTGLNTDITWRDPGEIGGKPKAIHRIKLQFPRSTRFDTSALPTCDASDQLIRSQGTKACPAASKLGSGSTEAVLVPGIPFNTEVTLFNAKDQIIVVVTGLGIVLTEFRDEVNRNSIMVNPVLPLGVSLRRLTIGVDPHATGHGAARRVYLRAPTRCPQSRRWSIVGTFTYDDGSTQTLRTSTPCTVRSHPSGDTAPNGAT